MIVIVLEIECVWSFFFDPHIQNTLTAPYSRSQLCIEPLNSGVLKQELQAALQRIDVERRPGVEVESLLKIAGAKPLVPSHLDPNQLTFDDLIRNHAASHRLIREDRSGIDIAVVNIEERQRNSKRLDILRRELSIPIGSGDFV